MELKELTLTPSSQYWQLSLFNLCNLSVSLCVIAYEKSINIYSKKNQDLKISALEDISNFMW